MICLPGFSNSEKGSIDSLKTLLSPAFKSAATPDSLTINRINSLASQYFMSNPDSTLYYGRKGIDLSKKINYQAGIANGLVQTGHANYFKGNYAQAKQDFDAAILIYKRLNAYNGLSNCYILYGRMYNLTADYKQALSYINLALNINLKLSNELGVADCYKNIGIVYYSQGKLPVALDFYYKALFIAIKDHNKLAEAANYNDIGVVLESMEVYPKASEYYIKALRIFETNSNNLQGVGTVYENIGEVYLAQKEYDRAIFYSSKSLGIAKRQDDKEGMSSLYTDLGLCYANKNQFEKAIRYLDTALQITTKFQIVYNQANALIGFATVYNLQSDYKKAYQYAIQGQQLAIKLGNHSVRYYAAMQLNETLAGLGRYNEAYDILKQFIALKDSLNNNESIQKLTSYNLELDFASKQRQLEEKDILYRQSIKLQRLINTIILIIMLAMITTTVVYYRQKLTQQKINSMLGEKNKEILQQKADLDDQAHKLNDLNVLKDRLISVLAHDLRAPLSTLRGLFSLLQDNTITHEEMLAMIPDVLKKLEYTSDFLDTLLFWINSQVDSFESVAKNFYIKDIAGLEVESYHEQAALKGIKLINSVPDDITAWADPSSVRIVIRNLITNAIKFSKQNDVIEISAVQQSSQSQMITVKDTGSGMSEDLIKKLFWKKVESNTGTLNETGTGMGLLFCKDLVEKCNGKIWVTSKIGEGTEFCFTLPAGILDKQGLVFSE